MKRLQSKPVAAILTLFIASAIAPGNALAQAQDGLAPSPLSRKLASHLIAEFDEIGVHEVKVAFIISGKLKRGAFESERGAEVTYLTTAVEEGRRKRAIHCITFLHDQELGWFLERTVEDDGGRTYIDVCSELQGPIRVE